MQKAVFVISLLISLGSQGLSQEACVIHVTDGDVPVPGTPAGAQVPSHHHIGTAMQVNGGFLNRTAAAMA